MISLNTRVAPLINLICFLATVTASAAAERTTTGVPWNLRRLAKAPQTYPAADFNETNGVRALCIRVRMPHGHGAAGEGPEEIRALADSILKKGKPLARITSQSRKGDQLAVAFESRVPIVKAELNFTKDTGVWQKRNWETISATLDAARRRATATIPTSATVFYLNLTDECGLVVSSKHIEIIKP